ALMPRSADARRPRRRWMSIWRWWGGHPRKAAHWWTSSGTTGRGQDLPPQGSAAVHVFSRIHQNRIGSDAGECSKKPQRLHGLATPDPVPVTSVFRRRSAVFAQLRAGRGLAYESAPVQNERTLLLALFCISTATSTLLDAGIVCSNDGSHYALVRALADDHTVVIDRYVDYTHHVDVGFRNGHFYSDRPPGPALVALPFYLLACAAGLDDAGREAVTAALSILCGALAVVLTFLVGRRVGLSQSGALCAALALALCTPHRSYSTVLFNHAL